MLILLNKPEIFIPIKKLPKKKISKGVKIV